MSQPRPFTSWLAPHFDGFVALKHASGARYISQRSLLIAFDRYLEANAAKPPGRPRILRHRLDFGIDFILDPVFFFV